MRVRIKIGSVVRYANENFVVEDYYEDGNVGVRLVNGVYCEIPIEKLEKRHDHIA